MMAATSLGGAHTCRAPAVQQVTSIRSVCMMAQMPWQPTSKRQQRLVRRAIPELLHQTKIAFSSLSNGDSIKQQLDIISLLQCHLGQCMLTFSGSSELLL
jgi:hypothetical protein